MAKQGWITLFKFGKGTTIMVVILFAVFAPFFMIIRKEKMVRDLSRQREQLSIELLRLKSETASLELSIGQLSSAERLERYAVDTLKLLPADPLTVIAVQRDADGEILLGKKKNEKFLYKLMGNE